MPDLASPPNGTPSTLSTADFETIKRLVYETYAEWDREREKRLAERERRGIVEFSPTYSKIAAALVKARKGFSKIVADQVGVIKSEKANYSYKYADLNSVIAATTEPLSDNGIVVLQGPTTGDNSTLITVETLLLHESGEWIRTRISLKSTANTPQGVGSAITYARRYALQSMLGVASEDDDGKGAGQGQRFNDARDQARREPQRTDGRVAAADTTTRREPQATGAPQTGVTPPAAANTPAPEGMRVAIRKLFTDLAIDETTFLSEGTNGQKASVDVLTFSEGNQLLQLLQRRKADGAKR